MRSCPHDRGVSRRLAMRVRSRRIVCPEGTIYGEVEVEHGRISYVGPATSRAVQRPDDGLDLGDRWLVPGFIDGHVHGCGGAECNTSSVQDIARVVAFHAVTGR